MWTYDTVPNLTSWPHGTDWIKVGQPVLWPGGALLSTPLNGYVCGKQGMYYTFVRFLYFVSTMVLLSMHIHRARPSALLQDFINCILD